MTGPARQSGPTSENRVTTRPTRSAIVLACGAPFVSLLDVTIVNLAIPQLAVDFPRATVSGLTWVVTAYAVVFAALIAPFGGMADALGRRVVYGWGLALFTAASAACAVAPDLSVLLGARVVQAVGAAALVPTSLAIVLAQVAPQHRMAAVGAWAASASMAAALGPGLGGLLVDSLGWRWVFLINLPVGVALAFFLRAASPERRSQRLPDLLGALLLALGVGGIVLGISQGNEWGWTSGRSALAVGVGLVASLAAVRRSWHHPTPGIEVGLWRTRDYASANLVSVFFGMMLYPWLLVGILFLNDVWGFSALEAGLAVTHGAVFSAIAGAWASKRGIGARAAMVSGGLLLTATAASLALLLTPDVDLLLLWVPTGVTCGIGIGLLSTGVSAAAALSVAPSRFASATGLNLAARQVGGAIGIAILAAILDVPGGPRLADYQSVYLLCSVAALAAAIAALLTSDLPGKWRTATATAQEGLGDAVVRAD
jgi:EmrB/QacA subfamily drug resistance transporter